MLRLGNIKKLFRRRGDDIGTYEGYFLKTPLVLYLDGVEVYKDDDCEVFESWRSCEFGKKIQFLEKSELESLYRKRIMKNLRDNFL